MSDTQFKATLEMLIPLVIREIMKNRNVSEQEAFDSEVWFNTPRFAVVERMQRIKIFGIKPDVIINFLSNEAPFEIMQRLKISCGSPQGDSSVVFLVSVMRKDKKSPKSEKF